MDASQDSRIANDSGFIEDADEAIDVLRMSPLLDPVWYRQTYPDLRDAPIDVARHYLERGAREGRNPHPLFDTNYYLEQNPDVAASGINPLIHYILYGEAEGRKPNPNWGRYPPAPHRLDAKSSSFGQNFLSAEFREGQRDDLVGITPSDGADSRTTKLIAFYLPQFYPFPENNKWWGEGFTEWTSVATVQKQFPEHATSSIPADLGFYDLRIKETRQRQGELAKQYGLYGFCYYFYWFAKRRIMAEVLEMILAQRAPDLPFCLCWANETWSRRWDGSEKEVLALQEHEAEVDTEILRDLMPFFRDDRYIRINGAPLLVMYRLSLMPEPERFVTLLREAARREGLPGLFLCNVMSFGDTDPGVFGCDAAVEFPPHGIDASEMDKASLKVPKEFSGLIYDYEEVVANRLVKGENYDFPYFPGVMPRWDNTARRGASAHIFHNARPEIFETWLSSSIEWTQSMNPDCPLVFVNSWNEWGEGAHLEPDRKYGRRFLEAIRRVVSGERAVELATLRDNESDATGRSLVGALFRENQIIAKRLEQIGRLQGPEPLFAGFPQAIDPKRLLTDVGSGHFDRVNSRAASEARIKIFRGSTMRLAGWVVGNIKHGNSADSLGYLLFTRQPDKKCFHAVILEWIERQDVSSFHGFPEQGKYCGFSMMVDTSLLDPGTYATTSIVVDGSETNEVRLDAHLAVF